MMGKNMKQLEPESEQIDALAPADGKCLYVAQDSKGVDFRSLLAQAVQCVNLSDVLSKIHTDMQYVVQIPAEFQSAYESGEMFIMENMKTGKKWPSLMRITEDGKHQEIRGIDGCAHLFSPLFPYFSAGWIFLA